MMNLALLIKSGYGFGTGVLSSTRTDTLDAHPNSHILSCGADSVLHHLPTVVVLCHDQVGFVVHVGIHHRSSPLFRRPCESSIINHIPLIPQLPTYDDSGLVSFI